MGLHGLERRLVDQRRHLGRYQFGGWLWSGCGAAPVEFVLSDIGCPGQDAAQLANTPPATIAGEDAPRIQVRRDGLNAHGAGCAVALQGETVDEPHCVRVQRVNFQPLFDFRAALLRCDDAVANRRAGAVPKTLARVFFHGAQRVLAVFFGLVLVEQRHNLAHHDVHRVFADFLGDGDQFDAVFRQFSDVEFEFEVVAEEAAEGVDDDDIEGGGFGGAGFDHALEFGAAVIGGGGAGFDEGFHELVAACEAVSLALAFLVGDGDVMLGLARGGDAQVEGGAQGSARCHAAFKAFCTAFGLRSMTRR